MDWEKEQNKLDAMTECKYREDVVNNPEFFDADIGKIKWTSNDGAAEGTKEQYELQAGDKLVRYDTLDGSYFAPADAKYEDLGLPYDESKIQKTYWEVNKPFTVEKSEIAPAFGSDGGAVQYRLNSSEGRISEYNNEHEFLTLLSSVGHLALFRHRSPASCEQWSKYFGDYEKTDIIHGVNNQRSGLFSNTTGNSIQEQRKNYRRVRQEDLHNMSNTQMCAYNASSGEIIFADTS